MIIDKEILDLRILTYIDCEEKIHKITEILNFCNSEDIFVRLSILYDTDKDVAMRAENIYEHQDNASLTIDMRDNKMRFKYFNGLKTFWAHHVKDLIDIIMEGRRQYDTVYDRYMPVSTLLYDWRNQNKDKVYNIRHKYYPGHGIDVKYTITFETELQEGSMVDILLKELYQLINDTFPDNDFNMEIDYIFKAKCSSCEKRKQKNESNQEDNVD